MFQPSALNIRGPLMVRCHATILPSFFLPSLSLSFCVCVCLALCLCLSFSLSCFLFLLRAGNEAAPHAAIRERGNDSNTRHKNHPGDGIGESPDRLCRLGDGPRLWHVEVFCAELCSARRLLVSTGGVAALSWSRYKFRKVWGKGSVRCRGMRLAASSWQKKVINVFLYYNSSKRVLVSGTRASSSSSRSTERDTEG